MPDLKRNIIILSLLVILITVLLTEMYHTGNEPEDLFESEEEKEKEGYDRPDEFMVYFDAIQNREDGAEYPVNYQYTELKKARMAALALKKAPVRLNWVERGPGNIGGRTRGLIVDPADASGNTWFAGSAGGGIWLTSDGGQSWRNLTPGIPNLSTVTLEMAASNTNVLYAGTGELQAGATGVIKGIGIFKSTDRGETWNLLPGTSNTNFSYIHKILIDPKDENHVLVSGSRGIYKTTDGGINWRRVYYDGGSTQGLIADPNDFTSQYATVKRNGIIRSTDGGENWKYIFRNTDGRIEVDISPKNSALIYAMTDSSKLYVSADSGKVWQAATASGDPSQSKFLGKQGWWNNTVRVHPLNDQKIFIGGIDLYLLEITGTSGNVATYSVDTVKTGTFLNFVEFTTEKTKYLKGITLETDSSYFVTFEIRFGPGKKQKAHRFLVPEGSTSGVPDNQYSWQDYVEVPFEVWDTENNRKLMVSFRDQDRNGVFNLTALDDNLKTGREYIYIHSIPYADSPSGAIMVTGGQKVRHMAYIWPVLAAGGTWDPSKLPESLLKVTRNVTNNLAYNFTRLTRWSNARTSPTYLHADIHNIQVTTRAGNPFKLVVASDGGVGYSENGGTSWINPLRGYNTSQFYGLDRHPTQDQYIGGLQDNGSWYSGNNPNSASEWFNARGGDGFEVVWHSRYPARMITSLYYNQLYRTQNGGGSWSSITSTSSKNVGDTKAPFVTRIGNTPQYPDRIFIAGKDGVSKSENFGQSWQDIDITTGWGYSGISHVEVSEANPDVVWAGCRMTTTTKLFVSVDGGTTFNPTNSYPVSLGTLSGLVTHPTKSSTAFALFSFAGAPKILRTDNLGGSWVDISGYSGTSAGFPDVAVYSLLVTDTIAETLWAGTEIGLFVSEDNGKSWWYADNGLPAVSIWDMKMKGRQVMVATHGRGIWSVNMDEVVSAEETTVKPAKDGGITVYPNPCRDYVNIRFSAFPTGKVTTMIRTMDGKMVFQSQLDPNGAATVKLSFPKLSAGNYILEIKQNSGVDAKVISVQ
jgi:photosystem II stability/assembly factor-like uncharacterized protein